MVIVELTVERSIKDQMMIFPIPQAKHHINTSVHAAPSLGIATKNEHHVIAWSYSFKTTQISNTFQIKYHKAHPGNFFQLITI